MPGTCRKWIKLSVRTPWDTGIFSNGIAVCNFPVPFFFALKRKREKATKSQSLAEHHDSRMLSSPTDKQLCAAGGRSADRPRIPDPEINSRGNRECSIHHIERRIEGGSNDLCRAEERKLHQRR